MSKELEEIKNIIAIHFGALGFYNPSMNKEILKNRDKVLNYLNKFDATDNAEPSEALESFDYIARNIEALDDVVYMDCIEHLNTIKQALLKTQDLEKRLKDLNTRYMDYVDKSQETIGKLEDNLTKEEQENIKLKRVLSIIKEKNVNIGWFKAVLKTKGDTYDCYLYWVVFTNQDILSQEEFELLKEMK